MKINASSRLSAEVAAVEEDKLAVEVDSLAAEDNLVDNFPHSKVERCFAGYILNCVYLVENYLHSKEVG